MPLYPPRSEPIRKKQILEKRIVQLKHALHHAFSDEKKKSAAEAVRYAQIKFLKVKVKTLDYTKEPSIKAKQLSNVEKEKEIWLAYSVEEIIQKYKE